MGMAGFQQIFIYKNSGKLYFGSAASLNLRDEYNTLWAYIFHKLFYRDPGGGHGNPLQYSCLKNPHGQRNLVDYSPLGHK